MAVFVILKNNDGEILLQQRANTGYLDGYYDFACSGHVDNGESLHETALRELIEEIGVNAEAEDLTLVHITQDYVDIPYINFTFILEKWVGTPKIAEPEKCSDLRYFNPYKLPQKCSLNVRVNEKAKFANELTYSRVMPEDYEKLMGV